MSEPFEYELIDFGDARRLERIGPWLLDRPCPTSTGARRAQSDAWSAATARYQGPRAGEGKWSPVPANWKPPTLELAARLSESAHIRLQLEPLPSGQIGMFPEQFANWQWIALQTAAHRQTGGVGERNEPLRVLNLFGYTGGSTLAAAAAGAQVVHVDAAQSVVQRARKNAAASELAEAPIRWIVEDALKFCQREVRRGKRYDAIILDPPSYGHGPKGESWSIRRDLLPLLELCGELTQRRPRYLLLTCHTPGIDHAELSAYLADGVFGHCGRPPRTGDLYLTTADGRQLPSGVYSRWPR